MVDRFQSMVDKFYQRLIEFQSTVDWNLLTVPLFYQCSAIWQLFIDIAIQDQTH